MLFNLFLNSKVKLTCNISINIPYCSVGLQLYINNEVIRHLWILSKMKWLLLPILLVLSAESQPTTNYAPSLLCNDSYLILFYSLTSNCCSASRNPHTLTTHPPQTYCQCQSSLSLKYSLGPHGLDRDSLSLLIELACRINLVFYYF